MASRRNLGLWLALLVPAGLLAGALISQYGFGLYPCEMCHWQRWPHYAALPFAALGLWRKSAGFAGLAALLVLISGLIGGFHAGVEYGWWEGLTACSVPTATSGGSALDAIMNAPLIRCDDAQWEWLGISLAGYNFLISSGAAIFILFCLKDKSR